ncbi:MAG: MFS transporter [Gammaproteobacteria bacterium]
MSASKPVSPLLWIPTNYFTMALCYVMLTTVTAIMFKNLGMDNGKAAEYSSALILAYMIKPLYAPIVEMYRTKKFFVLLGQVIVGLGFIGVGVVMSVPNSMMIVIGLFWVMSFVGATQDIASDGVYVTSLNNRDQALYCGIQSLAWNLGPIVGTGVLVVLSNYLHTSVFHHDATKFGPEWIESWRIIFFIVGGVTLAMAAWHRFLMPPGARAENTPGSLPEAGNILFDAVVTLFQKKGIWRMIGFAFLFRLSIGFLEKIGPFFMLDPASKGGLGLTNDQLGLIYGTYGLGAVLLGSLLGGMFVAKRGLKATIFTLCCAINIPNITFLLMSIYLPSSLFWITVGVVVEKFFYGFGAVGFMIYLMQQLAPGKYTTTHYAFGTGLMAMCMMVTGMISGHLQVALGYVNYFIFVMVATIPSFLICWFAPFYQSDSDAPVADKEVAVAV